MMEVDALFRHGTQDIGYPDADGGAEEEIADALNRHGTQGIGCPDVDGGGEGKVDALHPHDIGCPDAHGGGEENVDAPDMGSPDVDGGGEGNVGSSPATVQAGIKWKRCKLCTRMFSPPVCECIMETLHAAAPALGSPGSASSPSTSPSPSPSAHTAAATSSSPSPTSTPTAGHIFCTEPGCTFTASPHGGLLQHLAAQHSSWNAAASALGSAGCAAAASAPGTSPSPSPSAHTAAATSSSPSPTSIPPAAGHIFCTEPGCTFTASPHGLLQHLAADHSLPVNRVAYGKFLRLRAPLSKPLRLLRAENDGGLFALVVGDLGPVIAVSVVCPWAEDDEPRYAAALCAVAPPPDMTVMSSDRPGEVAVENLPWALRVPPTFLLAGADGASAEVSLKIWIQKTSSLVWKHEQGRGAYLPALDWRIDDGEAEPFTASDLSNLDAPHLSTLDEDVWAHKEAPSSFLVEEDVGKGFPKEMELKAIDMIVDTLVGNCSASGCTPHFVDDDDLDFVNMDDDEDNAGERKANFDGSVAKEMDKKIKTLEDNNIITSLGVGDSIFVLADSNHEVLNMSFKSFGRKKRKNCEGEDQGNQAPIDGEEPMSFPNPMVGFGLPGYEVRSVNRRLGELASGPPFFYYENVARAPKGVWRTISEELYNVEPEFVDSKYLCAAARQRGYVHNLPIENRKLLRPTHPKTIFGAFPRYKKWWPSWDSRDQLNCLSTCGRNMNLTKEIEQVLASAGNPPSRSVQKDVMDECRNYNLVWVGKNKASHVEPHEMEYLLGFPKDHTRGVGITKRYESLGNAFQVDTVAYHLSVLRDMFPKGMKVLSLFSGIGGAEVALHRVGIHLSVLVSVEKCEVNRRILRGWWNQTQAAVGSLIEVHDVKYLSTDGVKFLTRACHGFDLVIGGSPCNNLAGRNRFHRDGLEGEQSALFYDYSRILKAVKSAMETM